MSILEGNYVKKRIIILLIFLILLVVGFLIFIFPKIQEKMDFQKLEKRVAYVNLVFASDKKMKEVTYFLKINLLKKVN